MQKKQKKVSEERVLQICNDIAESINNPVTVAELKGCITYWQDRHMEQVNQINRLTWGVANQLLVAAGSIFHLRNMASVQSDTKKVKKGLKGK